MNTRKIADVGLGAAIAYFTSIGWSVSIPLTESQRYDLVVDDSTSLKRVEVKTTDQIRYGNYVATLKTSGGNKSGHSITNFDGSAVDLLFILAGNNTRYCIPSKLLNNASSLALGKKVEKHKV